MPAICVCDCGFDVEDGQLCLDWHTVGMGRTCVTAAPYSNSLAGVMSTEEWFHLRDAYVDWRNDTCWTHRVVARSEVPYVRILVGPGNRWEVRCFLDAGIDTTQVPTDDSRTPEMLWTSNWATGMPAGTAQYQEAPGAADREFLVPPGSRIVARARIQARVPAYVPLPVNQLAFGALMVTLTAWPSQMDSGVGRTC